MNSSLQQDVNLAAYNTLGIPAIAARFVEIESVSQLESVLGIVNGRDILVIGGGSNVVLTGDVSGWVLLNAIKGIDVLEESDSAALVRVAAGENWDCFVQYSLERGWFGLENLSAIPGSVGAAPIQNIGAYGVELKSSVAWVETLEISSRQARQFTAEACRFGYRESLFKQDAQRDRHIITAVVFRLSKTPDLKLDYGEIRAEMASSGLTERTITAIQLRELIIQIRARKLPNPELIPNVGSFFKNPVISRSQFDNLKVRYPQLVSYPMAQGQQKLAAGWLIDQLGWRGRAMGQARVHEHQALVLTLEDGQSADLLALAGAIREDVKLNFGIELEIEPRVI